MKLSIQKWGNSAAVRLPSGLLDYLNLALGDKLAVEIRPDGILLVPTRTRYALEELVAQCDKKAPLPAGIGEWEDARQAGRETW